MALVPALRKYLLSQAQRGRLKIRAWKHLLLRFPNEEYTGTVQHGHTSEERGRYHDWEFTAQIIGILSLCHRKQLSTLYVPEIPGQLKNLLKVG